MWVLSPKRQVPHVKSVVVSPFPGHPSSDWTGRAGGGTGGHGRSPYKDMGGHMSCKVLFLLALPSQRRETLWFHSLQFLMPFSHLYLLNKCCCRRVGEKKFPTNLKFKAVQEQQFSVKKLRGAYSPWKGLKWYKQSGKIFTTCPPSPEVGHIPGTVYIISIIWVPKSLKMSFFSKDNLGTLTVPSWEVLWNCRYYLGVIIPIC